MDLLSSLEGMVAVHIAATNEPPTAESIRDIITRLRAPSGLFSGQIGEEEAEELARKIEEKNGISMGLGAIVDAHEFRPWLHDAKINREIGDFYWGRYRQLLSQQGLPKNVIDATDKVTDKILDRLGNPRDASRWSRRGMIVGHVQSGKTANYIGLICKAADAGYRLIVVIAGIHNNLRNQTQARIDQGFIGRDTGRLAHASKSQRKKIIGVGRFDAREFPVSLTNTMRDFNKATATTNTSQIGQYNVPVVLVIKKNYSTLKNLLEWLTEHSVQQGTQMVSQPMLLIDDEADNASINTAYGRDEVTRINSQIRELLSLFQRSCYVGYTATPFANIFIDPETDDEVLRQDLFPRHFIIGLDAPSNYFGAQKVLVDQTDQFVRLIDDNEDVLPMGHKIDHPVSALPDSLVRAVRTFAIARAIRNLRGQSAAHASMLVNASRFTGVQGRLRERINDLVSQMRDAATIDGAKETDAALRNSEIAALHVVWQDEYADLAEAPAWPDIQCELYGVLAAAQVVEVNSSKRTGKLDYDQGGEHGVTVIAVGGYSLSRGLTLEGLTVSYFLRNSKMYDTLMQMGRWFGYRPGYEDLCRIWMPAESVGWYAHIHDATDDLQAQLKEMELAGATPEDFGLAVRSHPEALIVTARNKMGAGRQIPVRVNLSGKLVETTRIRNHPEQIGRNRIAGEQLVRQVRELAPPSEHPRRGDGTLFRHVPVASILDFLLAFRADTANPLTDSRLMRDYIEKRAETELREWDVLFASAQKGDVTAEKLTNLAIKPFDRSVGGAELEQGAIAISGASRRVGSPGDEQEGLTEDQIETAINAWRKRLREDGKREPKTIPPRVFCEIKGRRPLLILRYVRPKISEDELQARLPDYLLAWSICFPPSAIAGGAVDYVINSIRAREMFGDPEIDDEQELSHGTW